MARTVSTGTNGTAQAGITPLTFAMNPVNFTADFKIIEDGPGKVIYTDLTAPLDQPSTIRIAQQNKANVYAGTSIDPSVYAASKSGTDTIVELREVWRETDSVDTTYQVDLPMRGALTLSIPNASQISAAMVETFAKRLVAAALYAQGVQTPSTGINALLHGVVKK